MKKILLIKDYAFVYLNRNFYDENIILNTLKIYKNFINYSISKLGKYYIIKLKLNNKSNSIQNINYNLNNEDYIKKLNEIVYEFINYLLSLEYNYINDDNNENNDNNLNN